LDDPVHHPSHYTSGPIECIEALHSALGPEAFVAFCRGAAIKYCWRAGRKDDLAQELRKAQTYLGFALQVLDGRNPLGKELA
jgi:hypothetical protein